MIQAGSPQVGYPLGHPRDAGDDVAMGDHDALWYSRGSAGVHDDGDVRGPRRPALTCCWNVNRGGISCARELRHGDLRYGLYLATRGAKKNHICAFQHNLAHPCLKISPLCECQKRGGGALLLPVPVVVYTCRINR